MVAELLRWWARQMLELVPGSLRTAATSGTALVVAIQNGAPDGSPGRFRLILRQRRGETELGSFALDEAGLTLAAQAVGGRKRPAQVLLRPSPGALLERDVVLPLAAERAPERVLFHEMDRLTPFAADRVFWDWAVKQRDRARARLHLRLSLVPKADIEPFLAGLARIGLHPTILEAASRGGTVRRIGLDRPEATRARWRRIGLGVAGGACAALAVAALALPFLLQESARRTVEARIAALQPLANEAETLRRRAGLGETANNALEAERARVGHPLEVLAAVTEILPDDTFLTELQMRKGKVSLIGQSAAAARLIPALAADKRLHDPAFVAPVTRSASSNADLFSITAELRPGQ
jgi:general secretion pathway protein L